MQCKGIVAVLIGVSLLTIATGCAGQAVEDNHSKIENLQGIEKDGTEGILQETESRKPSSHIDRDSLSKVSVIAHIQGKPMDLAVQGDGSLLVTDAYNKVVWRIADKTASVYSGLPGAKDGAGEPAGDFRDGELIEARFRTPWGITAFSGGWAVADGGNGCIRWMDDAAVNTIAGQGNGHEMVNPAGMDSDGRGNLYIADAGAGVIYRMDAEGNLTVAVQDLNAPSDVCWQNGTLYVAETGNHRICAVKDGEFSVIAGSQEGNSDGDVANAMFCNPQGIAVDADGVIYVADTGNNAVRMIADGKVSTILTASDDLIWPVSPTGIALYGNGLAVADSFTGVVFCMGQEEEEIAQAAASEGGSSVVDTGESYLADASEDNTEKGEQDSSKDTTSSVVVVRKPVKEETVSGTDGTPSDTAPTVTVVPPGVIPDFGTDTSVSGEDNEKPAPDPGEENAKPDPGEQKPAPTPTVQTKPYEDLVIETAGTRITGGEYGIVLIAASVGNGNIYLDGVRIHGDLYVCGGGSHSVYVDDCTLDGTIILNKEAGEPVHLELEGTTKAAAVTVAEGNKAGASVSVGESVDIQTITAQSDVNVSTEGEKQVNVTLAVNKDDGNLPSVKVNDKLITPKLTGSKGGHKFDKGTVIAATCKSQGYTLYQCDGCDICSSAGYRSVISATSRR